MFQKGYLIPNYVKWQHGAVAGGFVYAGHKGHIVEFGRRAVFIKNRRHR